ncbi:hypothetical protein [Methylobacterium sp. ID0610]|uniref:hypothetical protein n=1 Tax=Methylobacterium carpenticola TaxID=3344827 RepID=UPI0036A93533
MLLSPRHRACLVTAPAGRAAIRLLRESRLFGPPGAECAVIMVPMASGRRHASPQKPVPGREPTAEALKLRLLEALRLSGGALGHRLLGRSSACADRAEDPCEDERSEKSFHHRLPARRASGLHRETGPKDRRGIRSCLMLIIISNATGIH